MAVYFAGEENRGKEVLFALFLVCRRYLFLLAGDLAEHAHDLVLLVLEEVQHLDRFVERPLLDQHLEVQDDHLQLHQVVHGLLLFVELLQNLLQPLVLRVAVHHHAEIVFQDQLFLLLMLLRVRLQNKALQFCSELRLVVVTVQKVLAKKLVVLRS